MFIEAQLEKQIGVACLEKCNLIVSLRSFANKRITEFFK